MTEFEDIIGILPDNLGEITYVAPAVFAVWLVPNVTKIYLK